MDATHMVEVGRRVQEARKRAGLTQQAVADVLGADNTVITKVEKGKRRLNGFELALVAERLGVSVRELLGMPSRRSVLAVAARLNGAGEPASKAARRAKELLELDALADELELPGQADPRWPVTAPEGRPSQAQGVRVAKALREELQLGTVGIADLIGLCEQECGLDVAVEPVGQGPSGLLVHHADDVALAIINSGETGPRRRFTLAHELAHHLFRDVEIVIVEDPDTGKDRDIERRADAFAAELLMPEEGVRRVLNGAPMTVATMVDGLIRFQVSREAWLNRVVSLGVVNRADAAGFRESPVRQQFAMAGRSQDHQPWEDRSGCRRAPARIESRLLGAYTSGRIGIGPLAQLAERDPGDLQAEYESEGIAPEFDLDDVTADI
jgi:transcriptional regulator with XRE-family HTH domain